MYMRFQKMYGDTSALQVHQCSCVLMASRQLSLCPISSEGWQLNAAA